MDNEKHTKGPWLCSDRPTGPFWQISSDYTVGGEKCLSGRQAVAAVHAASKKHASAYAEMFRANARLISAAPDLLDALRRVVAISDRKHDAWDAAKAAIAKATAGEQAKDACK